MDNDDIFDWYWQPNDLLRQTLAAASASSTTQTQTQTQDVKDMMANSQDSSINIDDPSANSSESNGSSGGASSIGMSEVMPTDPVIILTQLVTDVVSIKSTDLGVCKKVEQQHQANSQQMKSKLAQFKR